ncbi:Transposase DDE domain-containing protein, partial [Bacillus sp. ok061]
ITVYMTNIPTEWVPKEKIYDLYSLRWQIGVSLSGHANCPALFVHGGDSFGQIDW